MPHWGKVYLEASKDVSFPRSFVTLGAGEIDATKTSSTARQLGATIAANCFINIKDCPFTDTSPIGIPKFLEISHIPQEAHTVQVIEGEGNADKAYDSDHLKRNRSHRPCLGHLARI